jgi:hypothetical protein
MNPIKTGLILIELVRMIKAKFKSMQVKCMEIEEFIEESILAYVEIIKDEYTIEGLLKEEDTEGRDCLMMASKLDFFKMLQHEHVQEVINTIYKS